MKISILLISVSALNAVMGQGFVRQIHTIGNQPIIYDMPFAADSGSIVSKPIPVDSAVFQLYTNVAGANNSQTLTKLDEKVIGTYLPSATVQVLSEDPYFPPRTRADKPYGVSMVISGLQANSTEAPVYAKTVHVSRSYKLYDAVSHQPNGNSGTYADTITMRNNGTYVDTGIVQRLPGLSPTKAIGEESFTVKLHPDAGPTTELAKGTVQIWPVAVASIAGIQEGKRYYKAPTDGRFSVRDVYPKSVTYAQVYMGPQQTGKVGIPLPSTVVSYNTHEPQTVVLTLTDLEHLVDFDGIYTVEVLTITPFNGGAPELLAHVSFDLKRTISVNGSVTTFQ